MPGTRITEAKKRLVVDLIQQGFSVQQAALQAGMSRSTAHRHGLTARKPLGEIERPSGSRGRKLRMLGFEQTKGRRLLGLGGELCPRGHDMDLNGRYGNECGACRRGYMNTFRGTAKGILSGVRQNANKRGQG